MSYEKEKVWSVLLRLYHWSFAGSIVLLIFTGTYISTPWTNTMLEGSRGFPMAEMRNLHFIAAFVFSGAIAARIYLLFFGSKHERILDFAPVTPRNIKSFFTAIANYLYLRKPDEQHSGHMALGGTFYIIIYILSILQIISGFYLLYPENDFWQTWGLRILGPQQDARFTHHMIRWGFIIFTTVHLYLVTWNDIVSKNGLISSIFTGYKFKKVDD